MEIIRSHMISNRVIEHRKKLGCSILEVMYRPEERYLLL